MNYPGEDSPWQPLFEGLKDKLPLVSVQVTAGRTSAYRWITGTFESLASWENLEETDRYKGIIVTDENEIQSWIPYETIQSVSLT